MGGLAHQVPELIEAFLNVALVPLTHSLCFCHRTDSFHLPAVLTELYASDRCGKAPKGDAWRGNGVGLKGGK